MNAGRIDELLFPRSSRATDYRQLGTRARARKPSAMHAHNKTRRNKANQKVCFQNITFQQLSPSTKHQTCNGALGTHVRNINISIFTSSEPMVRCLDEMRSRIDQCGREQAGP